MPRIKRGTTAPPRDVRPEVLAALVDELRSDRVSGQPRIIEYEYPATGNFAVTVLWDRWKAVPRDDRADVIRRAYDASDGPGTSDRIAVAQGMTFNDAYLAAQLPFAVEPQLRRSDPVTREQCEAAMVAEGASTAFFDGKPHLLFGTEAEAEACIRRLTAAFPASGPVWVVTHEPVEDLD